MDRTHFSVLLPWVKSGGGPQQKLSQGPQTTLSLMKVGLFRGFDM